MEEVSLNINLASYKSVINSNAKFFLKFESLPVIEELSGQNVLITNENPAFLEKAVLGNGLRMRPKSSLSVPLFLSSPVQFSIGFWLRSSWIPPTISPVTNLPVYYRMALMDKASYAYASATGFISAIEATFSIYEECKEDGFNIMKIMLQSVTGLQIVLETDIYKTYQFNHFWITYYGPSRSFLVFVNGSPIGLFSEDGFPIPLALNNSALVHFNLNQSAIGYGSLLRNNAGLIDELVFLNQFIPDTSVIGKVINLGVEHAIDQSLLYKEVVDNCFAFDDPTALGVTSVLSNGKNFYAGRNDGALFKGDRTMWQVRRDFGSPDEIKFVKKNVFSEDSITAVENGSLKLFKSSVRI